MLEQEINCFVTQCGVEPEQLTTVNAVYEQPKVEKLPPFDILMVGGSGDHYVSMSEDYQFFPFISEFLLDVIDKDIPLYASCWGFQSLSKILGGTVIHDPDNTEVGTYLLTKTRAAEQDPLFSWFPSKFYAQMGHKDRVSQLPAYLQNLASSELSPNQAFRIPNKPVYASQFHPELNLETNRERFLFYIDKYHLNQNDPEAEMVLSRFKNSRHVSLLMPKYIKWVFPQAELNLSLNLDLEEKNILIAAGE